jgi:ZIP family zinc transporter
LGDLIEIVIYTALAGVCIPLGGLLARIEHFRPRWLELEFRHFLIAFGGGILLAAVSLVLVPEGLHHVPSTSLGIGLFLGGGVSFFLFESALGHRRRERPQVSAMLLDYVPETLALGGMFAAGLDSAPLLALLIGLQNIPEGFNAYRELVSVPNSRPRSVLVFMFALVPIGPVLGVVGWIYFANNLSVLGAIMLYAAGGILYLIFQDIAPQSRLKRHWGPPLGAVLGFGVGLIGYDFLGT